MDNRRLAIVVPAGGEAVLLCQAMDSVLCQEAEADYLIVIVLHSNCAETSEVSEGFRAAYPDKVRVLFGSNSSAQAARDASIRYLLESAPDVDAVLFLDPEDRMGQGGVDMLRRALDADATIGWFCADAFGFEDSSDPKLNWDGTLLQLALRPMQVLGLLARREVLESGIRFDQTHKAPAGWGFCIAALQAGYQGKRLAGGLILQRARPRTKLGGRRARAAAEAALVESDQESACGRRICIKLEHEEHPRFLLAFADLSRFFLFTDPLLAKETMFHEIEVAYFASLMSGEAQFPPFLVITTERKWNAILGAGLAHFVLWDAERRAEGARVAATTFMSHAAATFSTRSVPLQYVPITESSPDGANQLDFILIPTDMLRRLVKMELPSSIGPGISAALTQSLDRVVIRGPAELMGERPILTLASFVDALCETLRRSPYDEATRRDWFPAVLGPARNSPLMQEVRELAGGGICYPLV
jgi:hypothetical protein